MPFYDFLPLGTGLIWFDIISINNRGQKKVTHNLLVVAGDEYAYKPPAKLSHTVVISNEIS